MFNSFISKGQTLAAAAMICAATTQAAQAATIVDGTVGANAVDYIFFDFDGGALQINLDGVTLGDPMIRLFDDNGSAAGALTGTFLGVNDDGGPGLNSELSVTLLNGSYVLAVGAYFLSDTEARSGLASTPFLPGTYRATFSDDITVTNGIAAVPLPASMPLLLIGVGALGAARRRAAKA